MATGDSPCIIGKGTRIKGNLTGAEDLVIEGRLQGHIHMRSHLTLEESADVEASIVADALTIRGKVRGSIQVSQVVNVAGGAAVQADLKAPRVAIEPGARFTGRIDMDVPLPVDL
ncbi:MAG: polymer-forming cytoskeletal protein [Myxococcota bacterium]